VPRTLTTGGERFISAVALYGPKAEPLRSRLADVQAMLATQLGGTDTFRPYSLDQIHATLIAFNAIPGTSVNQYYLEHTGQTREMDVPRAMRILTGHLARPLSIRIGGYHNDEPPPFRSRGQHPFQRTFSVQGNAFLLIGWPTVPGRPLDRLRRDMNAANLLHRYHQHGDDVDDDCYLVVGHHHDAPPGALETAVRTVRATLAADPIYIEISRRDVKIVAADSHTLCPPLFAGDIPVDEATILALV
jgi:hypothetical protein